MYLKGVCSSAYFDLVSDVTNCDTSIGCSRTGRKASSAGLHALSCPAAQNKFLTPNSDGSKPTRAYLLAQLVPWTPRMSQLHSLSQVLSKQGQAWPSHHGEQHSGQLSATTPTSTGHAPSTPSWEEPPVQAGAGLKSTKLLCDRSPPLSLAPWQQQSLFRRALRAVCRAFLGTHRPRQQEQHCPAPSTRQVPGDGCSEPQQRPQRE